MPSGVERPEPLVPEGVVSWREQAACRGTIKVEVFYERDPRVALAVCAACPVVAECRAEADECETPASTFGVRGGETERERFERRHWTWQGTWKGWGRGRPPAPMRHGTLAGYRKHRYRGDVPCDLCVEAMRQRSREYQERYRARRKAMAS